MIDMRKHAIIDSNNVVENIILWDGTSEWRPPEGKTLVEVEEIFCGPGWIYENGVFTEPPPPPVEEIK